MGKDRPWLWSALPGEPHLDYQGRAAEKGLDARAAEITARAEVGVGTLYRRFGTKEALVIDIVKEGTADLQGRRGACARGP
jgi:hypothetical protein